MGHQREDKNQFGILDQEAFLSRKYYKMAYGRLIACWIVDNYTSVDQVINSGPPLHLFIIVLAVCWIVLQFELQIVAIFELLH